MWINKIEIPHIQCVFLETVWSHQGGEFQCFFFTRLVKLVNIASTVTNNMQFNRFSVQLIVFLDIAEWQCYFRSFPMGIQESHQSPACQSINQSINQYLNVDRL